VHHRFTTPVTIRTTSPNCCRQCPQRCLCRRRPLTAGTWFTLIRPWTCRSAKYCGRTGKSTKRAVLAGPQRGGPEIKYGLSVTGLVHPDRILTTRVQLRTPSFLTKPRDWGPDDAITPVCSNSRKGATETAPSTNSSGNHVRFSGARLHRYHWFRFVGACPENGHSELVFIAIEGKSLDS
jgi:hypothetical protein